MQKKIIDISLDDDSSFLQKVESLFFFSESFIFIVYIPTNQFTRLSVDECWEQIKQNLSKYQKIESKEKLELTITKNSSKWSKTTENLISKYTH